MGFSTLVSQTILFGTLIIILVTSAVVFGAYIYKTHRSLFNKYAVMEAKINTELSIQSITYDNVLNTTLVEIKNSGKSKIGIEYLDIYMDEIRIPRNNTNRTIQIQTSSEIRNPGIWDPKEIVEIRIFKELAGGTHFVEVFTEQAVTDVDTFGV